MTDTCIRVRLGYNETSTDTEEVDTLLTETEFENMGWPAGIDGVDSGVDRIYGF